MNRPLRPTLRCIREDLVSDWDIVSQQRALLLGRLPGVPLHDVAHPLVRAVADKFASPASPEALASRENISGTRDPTWWKAKSGRWRGAIYIDPDTDQAWLCAAGLRYEGEVKKDFYKVFTADVATHGPERYLPSLQDSDELAMDVARAGLTRWEVAAAGLVIQGVASSASGSKQTIKLPELPGYEMPNVELEIFEFESDDWDGEPIERVPAEVSLRLVISEWSDPKLLKRIQVVLCSAVAPRFEAWDTAPGVDATRTLLASIDESRLAQLRAASRLEESAEALSAAPRNVLPSSSAHWTHKNLLARALVEGLAVPALCGSWFVPTQDPQQLPVCEECSYQFEQMT